MLCLVIVHVINIVLLLVVMVATMYYVWPALSTRTFATDIGSLSQYVGAISSALATLAFLLLAFCGNSATAGLAMLCAIVDAVCYVLWFIKGNMSSVCKGAEDLTTQVSGTVAKYIQCDAGWMKYVLIGLLSASGVLQLAIALHSSYDACARPASALSAQQALGKPGMAMRSLGKRLGRRGPYARVGGRRAEAEDDEEKRLAGKGAGAQASSSSSESETDEDVWTDKTARAQRV